MDYIINYIQMTLTNLQSVDWLKMFFYFVLVLLAVNTARILFVVMAKVNMVVKYLIGLVIVYTIHLLFTGYVIGYYYPEPFKMIQNDFVTFIGVAISTSLFHITAWWTASTNMEVRNMPINAFIVLPTKMIWYTLLNFLFNGRQPYVWLNICTVMWEAGAQHFNYRKPYLLNLFMNTLFTINYWLFMASSIRGEDGLYTGVYNAYYIDNTWTIGQAETEAEYEVLLIKFIEQYGTDAGYAYVEFNVFESYNEKIAQLRKERQQNEADDSRKSK